MPKFVEADIVFEKSLRACSTHPLIYKYACLPDGLSLFLVKCTAGVRAGVSAGMHVVAIPDPRLLAEEVFRDQFFALTPHVLPSLVGFSPPLSSPSDSAATTTTGDGVSIPASCSSCSCCWKFVPR